MKIVARKSCTIEKNRAIVHENSARKSCTIQIVISNPGIDYKLEISQKLRDLKTYLVASNLEKHSGRRTK